MEALLIAGTIAGVYCLGLVIERVAPHVGESILPTAEPAPVRVTAPTHGPWADHALTCRCNVCR